MQGYKMKAGIFYKQLSEAPEHQAYKHKAVLEVQRNDGAGIQKKYLNEDQTKIIRKKRN